MDPHVLDRTIDKRRFWQVVAGHLTSTSFAIADAVALAVEGLEAHRVAVILRRYNKVSPAAQVLNRHLDLRRLVDRVL